jgi:hypothetical protein
MIIIPAGELTDGSGDKPLEEIKTLEDKKRIEVVMKDGQIVVDRRE